MLSMYFHYFTINFGWKRVWPLSFVVLRKMKICKVYKYDDNNVTNNEKCLAQQTAKLFFPGNDKDIHVLKM